jgi:hypothetical protein
MSSSSTSVEDVQLHSLPIPQSFNLPEDGLLSREDLCWFQFCLPEPLKLKTKKELFYGFNILLQKKCSFYFKLEIHYAGGNHLVFVGIPPSKKNYFFQDDTGTSKCSFKIYGI